MAIDVNKPVYVFDQERNKWYTKLDEDWIEIGTPTLTPNFAGIGTRNINQNGIEAIRDVYEIHLEKMKIQILIKHIQE